MAETRQTTSPSICIVTGPFVQHSGSYHMIFNNLVNISTDLSEKVIIISDNALVNPNIPETSYRYCGIPRPRFLTGGCKKIFLPLSTQIAISIKMFQLRNEISGPVLFLSGALFLPVLTSKILKKKSMLVAVASESNNSRSQYPSSLKSMIRVGILKILEKSTVRCADYVGIESPNVAAFLGLHLSPDRLVENGHLYLHDRKFMKTTNFPEREFCVGYIGRLSQEKGISNFIDALPDFLRENPQWHVIVVGAGSLDSLILSKIEKNQLREHVTRIQWVEHGLLPEILNRLRLLVVPSATEGLPNIVLEAMSCGTPVLAAAVGGIPDIIHDHETGYLLRDTTPASIFQGMEAALSDNNISAVSDNAVKFIEQHYSVSATKKKWQDILLRINDV